MIRTAHLLGILFVFHVGLRVEARAGQADESARVFESLFGTDVKRAKATRDKRDDIELAARMLATAKETKNQPRFLALLCETACDLASAHPDGYKTALGAMELLGTQVPGKASASAERVVAIRQKQFDASRGKDRLAAGEALIDAMLAAADLKVGAGAYSEAAAVSRKARKVARAINSRRTGEIEVRLTRLPSAMRAAREIARFKKQLEADPQNRAACEKVVRLYLVDLDRPTDAAKYVDGVEDASLRKYVPAAAKPLEEAPELACAELGEWYQGLAESAPMVAKAAMYARALRYYERFLELHTADDLDRTKVAATLKKVEAALAKLGGAPSARDRWIDLLRLVDPARDVMRGRWKRQGSAIAVVEPAHADRIAVPVVPVGSYELRVRFVRNSGTGAVETVLPAGSSGVCLHLSDGGGGRSVLLSIKRKSPDEGIVRPGRLENGREYTLGIKVILEGDQAHISVRMDGKPCLEWKGAQSALSLHDPQWFPKTGCLGLGSWRNCVVWRGMRLRMLSGKATVLRWPTAK